MKRHWIVLFALVLIYAAALLELNFIWGILFLFWTIPSFYTREVHLVQNVKRSEAPLLYWAIMLTWIVLSIWMIAADIPTIINLF